MALIKVARVRNTLDGGFVARRCLYKSEAARGAADDEVSRASR